MRAAAVHLYSLRESQASARNAFYIADVDSGRALRMPFGGSLV
ncbi:hypothetical protein HMPREF9999_00554 [Alloprevotella sp. oral taxon 473 str. F0040]|nr:hypothetical protein HMPREF9999_00554 [Alloprevotella sp. oral taxon 473 str. F0040]